MPVRVHVRHRCVALHTLHVPLRTAPPPQTAVLLLSLTPRGGMMIKVKTLTGKEIEIDIEPTDSTERIKERVEEKEGIPPVQQRCVDSCHLAHGPATLAGRRPSLSGSP